MKVFNWKSYNFNRLSGIFLFITVFTLSISIISCEADESPSDDDPSSDNIKFPGGSVWHFEWRRTSRKTSSFRPGGGCSDKKEPACTCSGHKLVGEPLYLDMEEIFSGRFRVEPGLFGGTDFFKLTPLEMDATVRLSLPPREYTETCSYSGGTRAHTTGQHDVNEVHRETDLRDRFDADYSMIMEGTLRLGVDRPENPWKIYAYSYSRSFNTIPGLVSGIGHWSSNDEHFFYEMSSFSFSAPLENGQWTEEDGPHYYDDHGQTYLGRHDIETITLRCIKNCKNVDCSQSCDDMNDCTVDTCEKGSGCKHQPRTGRCSDGDKCTEEGTCLDGQCVPGPAVKCDDSDPCVTVKCDPAHGCMWDADNKKLRNKDPKDCWQTICLNGVETQVPDPTETPDQGPPDDCKKQVCIAGVGSVELPDPTEIPPQESPTDCLRQVCLQGVGLIDLPDNNEPGCECNGSNPDACEDGNKCTRESCDPETKKCVHHGPDDSLIPTQIAWNCNKEVCRNGRVELVPSDDDPPVNQDPFDCKKQICQSGSIVTLPAPEEDVGCD